MKDQNFVGPQRTWRCESGQHESIIPDGSVFAWAWAVQQEQGPVGPLIIPDYSCELCHPQRYKLRLSDEEIA